MGQSYSERTAELREQVRLELFSTIGKSEAFDELVNRRTLSDFPSLDSVPEGSHLRDEVIASVWHKLAATFINEE